MRKKNSSKGKEKVKAEKSYLEQTKCVITFSSNQLLAGDNVHAVFWGLLIF